MLPLAAAGEQRVAVDGAAPAAEVEPRRVAELEALVADAQPSPAEEVRRTGRSVHRVKVEALAAPPACWACGVGAGDFGAAWRWRRSL